MRPNSKLGYTLEGSRDARYVTIGARLIDDDQGLGKTIGDRQTLTWTRAFCHLLETDPSTTESMAAQAQNEVKIAEIELPVEHNEAITESLGLITTLSFMQTIRLGIRRSVARDMLATITSHPIAENQVSLHSHSKILA